MRIHSADSPGDEDDIWDEDEDDLDEDEDEDEDEEDEEPEWYVGSWGPVTPAA